MMNNKDLINTFSKDTDKLNKILSNYKLYNFRNRAIVITAKGVLGTICLVPFLAAVYSVHNSYNKEGYEIFSKDDIIQYANIETIDTSNGLHIECSSFDKKYEEKSLEYTTGWYINENNLYEKITVQYKINKKDDLNIEELLAMSEEELNNLYKITNIEKVQKSKFDPEDYIYKDAGVVIIDNGISKDNYIERKETTAEDLWSTTKFFSWCIIIGSSILYIEKFLYKKLLKKKYEMFKDYFKIVKKDEMNEFKELYEIKKQNLDLITGSNEKESGKTYSLRKRQG